MIGYLASTLLAVVTLVAAGGFVVCGLVLAEHAWQAHQRALGRVRRAAR